MFGRHTVCVRVCPRGDMTTSRLMVPWRDDVGYDVIEWRWAGFVVCA